MVESSRYGAQDALSASGNTACAIYGGRERRAPASKRPGPDRLLRRLAARFINCTPEQLDTALDEAVAELGLYGHADRAHLFSLNPDATAMVCRHAWVGARGMPSAQGATLPLSGVPWLLENLQRRGLVCVDQLNDLPAAAHRERSLLNDQGIGSLAVVPIVYSGSLQGWLAFDLIEHEQLWDSQQLQLLRTAAEILAGALQRQASEQRIHQLAHYDCITGLPNRALLQQRLQQRLQTCPDSPFTLVLIDMDDAGMLNDLLGPQMGDRVLRTIGERLCQGVEEAATVARWGADEFIFCLPGSAPAPARNQALEHIRTLLAAPLQIADQSIKVSFSMGAVRYPEDARDVDSLLSFAELALRHGRREYQGSVQQFHPRLQTRATARSRLQQRLRHAVETRAFRLHYQPLLQTGTGEFAGVEALLRWDDSELGHVSPEVFVPLAEESGLIVPLGDWVLRSACEQMMRWRAAGLVVPKVSVNVSGYQLLDNHIPVLLESLLARHDLAASALEIEVTESTLLEHDMRSRPVLQRLRETGVGIAVDDFGTGYSSLSKLKHLQVNVLKIDRSFIQDIFTDENDRAIVIAVLAMARQLRLMVVAEGVETTEQQAFLDQHGCDLVQGFFHSPAMAPAVLGRWIESRCGHA